MLRKCRFECRTMQALQSKWLRILCTGLLRVHRIQSGRCLKFLALWRPLSEDGDWDHYQVGNGKNKTIKCWYDRYNPKTSYFASNNQYPKNAEVDEKNCNHKNEACWETQLRHDEVFGGGINWFSFLVISHAFCSWLFKLLHHYSWVYKGEDIGKSWYDWINVKHKNLIHL